jgi:chlorite dismutase
MSTATPSTINSVYWLFRADPAWRRLPAAERERGKREFLAALEGRDPRVTLRGAYSLVGLRADADLLLWVHGPDLDAIQHTAVELLHSGLGTYMTTPYAYVGVVSGGRYDPEHRPAFLRGVPPANYLSMYPFVKTADWYLLPYERRRELMAEHGELGRRYAPREAAPAVAEKPARGHRGAATTATAEAPAATTARTAGVVLSNTVDAYGLGDHEFIVAFEADDPALLCRMVEDLRTVEVRRYTKVDTPIFLGRRREPAEALADL